MGQLRARQHFPPSADSDCVRNVLDWIAAEGATEKEITAGMQSKIPADSYRSHLTADVNGLPIR